MKDMLQFDGHLDIEGPRGRLTLAGSGRTVTLAADSWRSFDDLLGVGPTWRRKVVALRSIHSRLASLGVAFEVRKGSRLVARIGRDGRPGIAALCLGIGELLSRIGVRSMRGGR